MDLGTTVETKVLEVKERYAPNASRGYEPTADIGILSELRRDR